MAGSLNGLELATCRFLLRLALLSVEQDGDYRRIEGQVDRFYKRLEARQQYIEEQEAQAASRTSPERPMEELEIGKRAVDTLSKSGIENVGQFLEKLAEGEEKILAIDGFGRKSLADVKKGLRRLGYSLPEDEVETESA